MTYSIVARDPDTGELGIAVATAWPAVGAVVPWVEPGVGAVATQAFTNIGLGPAALESLRRGQSSDGAMRAALETDPDAAVRQLAVVDAQGRATAHTGKRCVAEASHATAAGVSAQGNSLAEPAVPEAMLEAFRTSGGDLAERLLATLGAAEAAGGDARGRCSAALVVAPGVSDAEPWARRFDLRVDDSPDPLAELIQLLRVARAFEGLDEALGSARDGALKDAARGTAIAYELAPDHAQIAFWHGVVLLANDRPEEARVVLAVSSAEAQRWGGYARRVAEVDSDLPLAHALREAGRLLRGDR